MKVTFTHPENRTWRAFLVISIYIATWILLCYAPGTPTVISGVSLWYPPAGMSFALFLGCGWRLLPIPFIASLIAGLSLWSWDHWPYYLLSNATPPLIYASAAGILRQHAKNRWSFNSPQRITAFFAVTTVAALLSALFGTWTLIVADMIEPAHILKAITDGWISDLIGIITFTPVLFIFAVPMAIRFINGHPKILSRPPTQDEESYPDRPIIYLQIIVSLLMFTLVYWLPPQLSQLTLSINHNYPFAFLFLLLPLIWIANTGGIRGASTGIFLYELSIVLMVMLSDQGAQALEYQLVMIILASTGLLMGSLVQMRFASISLYRDLAKISNDLLWEFDTAGRLTGASGGIARGLIIEELIGTQWRNYIVTEEKRQDFEAIQTSVKQRQSFHNCVLFIRLPNQKKIWTMNSGLPSFEENGSFRGYRGTTSDISQFREAETLIHEYNKLLESQVAERTNDLTKSNEELIASEKRFRALSSAAPVGIFEADSQGECTFVNEYWCELTGLTFSKATHIRLIEIIHPDDREWVIQRWRDWIAIREKEPSQLVSNKLSLEYRVQRPDGRTLWVLANSVVLRDRTNQIKGYINAITDITETKRKEERTWRLANFDSLTKLPNRNLFFDRLQQTLQNARRKQGNIGLLLIDLDGFKQVNDTLGHNMGDKLLQQVAERLRHCLRASDTAARMGGDEFTVILQEPYNVNDAVTVAKKIVSAIQKPFSLDKERINVSASIGVVVRPAISCRIDDLVKMADDAMYMAKRGGKNCFHAFDDFSSQKEL